MPPSFDVELVASLDHLGEARRRFRDWLLDEVADEVARDDLVAVAGELFVHVVVRTAGRGRARLVAERTDAGVRLAVMHVGSAPASGPNGPSGSSVRSLALPPDPLAVGAIGRRLVEGCCSQVRVAASGAECFRALSLPPAGPRHGGGTGWPG